MKIWLTDSKYGVILHDEPALMRCPYPEKFTYVERPKYKEITLIKEKDKIREKGRDKLI
jgi:hypothetical protein